MIENPETEIHHRVPRSLLSLHDRMMACEELDGTALQAWFDFEGECRRHGVSPDLSREELEAAIEGSALEVSREEHRDEIHAADWPRWGRMGGLKVLELYGPRYFAALAHRRWRRISPEELARIRERLRRTRRASARNNRRRAEAATPMNGREKEVYAMANYAGYARSNYFRVRDEAAFLSWVETLPGVVARREDGNPERFALLVENSDDGGWPNRRYHEEAGDEEIDLHVELAGHLIEGEVAILQEVGAEKLRYLVGYAVAVNHRGEGLAVSIDDVYEKVRTAGWGDDVSTATY